MAGDAFRADLNAQPFRPFPVKTTDGDTFTVHHPDYALLSGDDAIVTIRSADAHYHVIAMSQIVSLEPAREQAKKPGRR